MVLILQCGLFWCIKKIMCTVGLHTHTCLLYTSAYNQFSLLYLRARKKVSLFNRHTCSKKVVVWCGEGMMEVMGPYSFETACASHHHEWGMLQKYFVIPEL